MCIAVTLAFALAWLLLPYRTQCSFGNLCQFVIFCAAYVTERLFSIFEPCFFYFQSAYVQAITVFLIVVLTLTDNLTIGDLRPDGPFVYLASISLISFMVGLWALFVFFNITKEFDLLHDYKYKQKAGLLKAIVVLVNVQVYTDCIFFICCNRVIFIRV